MPTEFPAPRPARAPPLRVGTPKQAGWDDDPTVFDLRFLTFLTDGSSAGALEVWAVTRIRLPKEAVRG